MRKEQFHADVLRVVLKTQKVATLQELKEALGTRVGLTVLRKLRELDYLSSYSHRGKYYTLGEIADFDEQGLWSLEDICFSKYGTLVATAEAFVEKSEAGHFVQELDKILRTGTKETLLGLVRKGRLVRERISGLYLYCSNDSRKQREQVRTRRILDAEFDLSQGLRVPRVSAEELRVAIVLFMSSLNERDRRLYAGLESLKSGYGGDRRVAQMLQIDVQTVAKGRRQLLEGEVEPGRVRKRGGGRTPIKNAGSDRAD